MTVTSYDIAFIFSEIFTLYSVKIFFDIFFKPKKGYTLFTVGAYAVYFIGMVLIRFFPNVPFVNLISSIAFLFLITLCCDAPMRKRIFAVLECYLIMFASEIVVVAVTKSANIGLLEKYEYSNIVGLFISRMIIFLTVLLISKIADMRKNQKMPWQLYLSSLAVPIFTVLIEILFTTTSGATAKLVVLSVIMLFLINMVIFFLLSSLSKFYERSLNSAYIEHERSYFKNQCELMQKSAENLRSFKHDISNHFAVIESMIENENYTEAAEYLKKLIESKKAANIVYSDTGNVAVDSIINYKLCNAAMSDIEVTTEMTIPNNLSVEAMDLSTILTNLLDNSIQALKKINTNRRLNIKMTYTKGILLIDIRNTYDGIVRYENGELVTTKEEKEEHGYGMRNVEAVVRKYNGLCKITHDERIFSTKVLLYVNELI